MNNAISEEEKCAAWKKAQCPDADELTKRQDTSRRDPYGELIRWEDYGNQDPEGFGWTVVDGVAVSCRKLKAHKQRTAR